MEQFYVQQIARYFMNKVIPLPTRWDRVKDMPVSASAQDWLSALCIYRQRMLALLKKVYEQPKIFGMVCYRFDDKVHEELLKSQKSFLRLPKTLVVLANEGTIQSDGSLFCYFDALKNAKITHIEAIINGLAVSGWTITFENKNIVISDPDCPNVFWILKALAVAGGYDYVMSADIRLLQNDEVTYTADDFARLIPAEHLKNFIRDVCALYEELGYCIKTGYGRYLSRLVISKTKSGKELITMGMGTEGQYTLVLRLSHIVDYQDKLHILSPGVLKQTLSGHDCGGRGWCKGPICFTFQGTTYRKCSILYEGFCYPDPTEEDIKSLWQLMAWEWDYIQQKIDNSSQRIAQVQ